MSSGVNPMQAKMQYNLFCAVCLTNGVSRFDFVEPRAIWLLSVEYCNIRCWVYGCCSPMLGVGCMVAAVRGATEKEPTVVGKPSTFLIDFLQKNKIRCCSGQEQG